MEIAYNNSFHATIDMTLYEALYGQKRRSSIHWDEIGERKLFEPKILQQTSKVISRIKKKMKVVQDKQELCQ